MEDSTSAVFKSTADELCSGTKQAMTSDYSFPRDTSFGCKVESLRQGSIIVVLLVTFNVYGSYTIPDNDEYVQTIVSYIGADMKLGSFTVIYGSIAVIVASYKTQGIETRVTKPTTPEPTTTEPKTPTPPEMQLVSSLSTPNGDLIIECNVHYAPKAWNTVKLMSSDANTGILAVGHVNGTTQSDNNAHHINFRADDSNVSISLLFPNTTKHCFSRSNYTCSIYRNEDVFVETTEYISTPVEEAAQNPEIDGITTVNEGDTYTVNCSGDLAPPSTTLNLFTRTANATSFTKSSVVALSTIGNITESCYLQTTKSYNLIADRTDNGTEMRCEAVNTSPGSQTISDSRVIVVNVAEMQLVSSLSSPNGDLIIECNVHYAPKAWNTVKLVSSDANTRILAVGHVNGTTQSDNNAYHLNFQADDSNVSISLLFPNTTKHCFARSNYTCSLYRNEDVFVETTEYISTPVEEAAQHPEIEGITTVNEGDTYTANCSGDLAPPSTTLNLFTRTANATSFTKSSVVALSTIGNLTESCYLQTTKSYNLIADRTDNGTEMRCEAVNTSPGSRTISDSRVIVVNVAEMQLVSSLSSPNGDLIIECNVHYAPKAWNTVKLMSSDANTGILAVGHVNGTTQSDNNAYQLNFQADDSNVSISLLFPNTTKHCFARSNYTCSLYRNEHVFVETTEYISIPVEEAAQNPEIDEITTVNEGDTYTVNCSGDLAPQSTTLDLYTRTANATSYTKSPVDALVTIGNLTESCYIQTTKSYNLIADRTDNGTEMRCEAVNTSPGSQTISDSRMIVVNVAEMQLASSLSSPNGDLIIECNAKFAPKDWSELKLMSNSTNIGVVAVGYVNGSAQKDNSSYQMTLQSAESNVSISLLFPNTTKHCFVGSDYTCLLYRNGDIVVETTEYISIPAIDAAENVVIFGNTTLNEGDKYEVNCTGDLAPPSSTLDLYIKAVNATSFKKSSASPQITIDKLTDVCYLQTTKSYTFVADRDVNGTQLKCEGINATAVSGIKSLIVRIIEMEMNDSITTPGEEMTISCNIRYAPSGWEDFSIVSEDNTDIHGRAFPNGTIVQGNSTYIVGLQQNSEDMTLSIMFPNTTTHCTARGRYMCRLTFMGSEVINDTATAIISDLASGLVLEGNNTVQEGERYTLNCSGKVATEGGDLELYVRFRNTSDFVKFTEVPTIAIGGNDDSCYQTITKTYELIAETVQNGSEFQCVATNNKLTSYQISSTIDMVVDFADFSTSFHLQNTTWVPAYGDKNSPEFKAFAESIENDTDYVYSQSPLKDNFQRSKVIELKPGSVFAVIVMFIHLELIIDDGSSNIITTKLTPSDIISAFTDTLPLVSNNLSNSTILQVDTDSITGEIVITDPEDDFDCVTRTDVIFLLDASTSIGSSNFILMKYFIKNYTANILLGSNAIQIGIAKFSTNASNEFWLNEHYGALTINPAIDAIVYTSRSTCIAKGLEFVRSNSLTTANGARQDASKVIILMTDGQAHDQPAAIASTLRAEGVLIACVGIGSGIDMTQLNNIAYNSSFIFLASDFNVLAQIADTVKGSSCFDNGSGNQFN
ncbi:uncharacterized protein LOC117341760 [Pecten maximus]|uniref:uncharacterized protein LOC117341760 n=1 Tax=Pecten maximus TaxID=6579 RepID=UPI0014584ECD|nr:uncharacterized protein LOC117341760 [Pecten maximus]